MSQLYGWSKRPFSILMLVVLGLILALQINPAQTAPEGLSDWEGNPPGTRLSANSNNGALAPAIAYSPNGSTLAAVYLHNLGAFKTPFVRISTNDGGSWTNPTRVVPGSSVDATNVDIAIDAANKVHIVWIELNSAGQTATLRYANNSSGSWVSQTLSQINYGFNSPGMSRPRLLPGASNSLDVVWSENYPNAQTNNPNVLHIRSTNGGTSWGAKNLVASTVAYSLNPDVGRTSDGKLHVVWEEAYVVPTESSVIRYAFGSVSGTTSSWTFNPANPINLANGHSDYAVRPAITTEGNTVHVIYNNRDGGDQAQKLELISCATNCGNGANWTFSSSNPITGGLVGANTQDPFNLIPSIAWGGSCMMVYYHGTDRNASHPLEVIFGSHGCGGWNGDDRATDFNTRATYPDVASDGDWLQLVYELRNETTGDIQIYYRRRPVPTPGVFLPLLMR